MAIVRRKQKASITGFYFFARKKRKKCKFYIFGHEEGRIKAVFCQKIRKISFFVGFAMFFNNFSSFSSFPPPPSIKIAIKIAITLSRAPSYLVWNQATPEPVQVYLIEGWIHQLSPWILKISTCACCQPRKQRVFLHPLWKIWIRWASGKLQETFHRRIYDYPILATSLWTRKQ